MLLLGHGILLVAVLVVMLVVIRRVVVVGAVVGVGMVGRRAVSGGLVRCLGVVRLGGGCFLLLLHLLQLEKVSTFWRANVDGVEGKENTGGERVGKV